MSGKTHSLIRRRIAQVRTCTVIKKTTVRRRCHFGRRSELSEASLLPHNRKKRQEKRKHLYTIAFFKKKERKGFYAFQKKKREKKCLVTITLKIIYTITFNKKKKAFHDFYTFR